MNRRLGQLQEAVYAVQKPRLDQPLYRPVSLAAKLALRILDPDQRRVFCKNQCQQRFLRPLVERGRRIGPHGKYPFLCQAGGS